MSISSPPETGPLSLFLTAPPGLEEVLRYVEHFRFSHDDDSGYHECVPAAA